MDAELAYEDAMRANVGAEVVDEDDDDEDGIDWAEVEVAVNAIHNDTMEDDDDASNWDTAWQAGTAPRSQGARGVGTTIGPRHTLRGSGAHARDATRTTRCAQPHTITCECRRKCG